MTRRGWTWIAVGIALVVLVGIGVFYTVSRKGGADCTVAREMIAYNKSQSQLLAASFAPEQDRETSIDQYRQWAGRLHTYSARISAPEIAAPAARLAAEADRLVGFVEHIRSTNATADPTKPLPGVEQYGDIARHFQDDLVALDQACPAQ